MQGCIGLLVALLSGQHLLAFESPFPIENKTQLFIDRLLIADSENLAFTLHQGEKHPRNPLVKADKPWEGWRLQIYGTVLYDAQEKLFKMWYFAESTERFPDFATYYATSKDGIVWDKPLVGTVESKVPGKHNAVADGVLLASVTKDLKESDPSRRYKMVCWRQKAPHGAQTMVSPDGLHWTELKQKICRSSDVITAFYDPRSEQYVAFPKLVTKAHGHVRRTFGLSTSKDFLNWTPSQDRIFFPDLQDDVGSLRRIDKVRHLLDRPDDPSLMRTEFYGIGAYPHESCTIAFPWMFTINNNARYGNHEGPMEIQLAVSRDLRNWERPFRTPIVAQGKKGTWDEGMLFTSSTAISVGDEVWLYYGGANYTHGNPAIYREADTGRLTRYTGSIGLVRWKRDRFVSVDGPAEGGVLTTVPVTFTGRHLEINAATQNAGTVTVEFCDAAGNPLPNYKPSSPFQGDSLGHAVQFPDSPPTADLAGKPIAVRFRLKNARLYSFGFKN